MISQEHNKKTLQAKVKAFFQGYLWKKTLTFLFFLLLAFGFWILQSLQRPFETGIDVPIRYINIPKEIVLDNNIPTGIRITIRDKGTSLLKYTIGKKRHEGIEIDLKNIDLKKSAYTVFAKELATKISNNLSANTSLVSGIPDFLEIKYQALQKKKLHWKQKQG